ncbi:sgt1 and cs domain containing protein [Ophiostoma piceae UAMH 11346]|uniref:Sgt1 and cs domain containing protein n=1 Tax=Ophiostoma piceae (strain UAMH 11346) TaxID=1262450 RepID=S3D6V6_OPHP1|nr:sgt1 and cs domain containing protein [Ophiostoma piceae UAMH 11346]
MSAITAGQNGLVAAEKKEWKTAITLLSQGINGSTAAHPNPAWLLARAQAYQNEKQYANALTDAERAYTSALFRNPPNQRQLLALIQYRRAVTLGSLKRFADADACCIWSQQLISGKNFRTEEDDVVKNVDADGYYLATAEQARKATQTMPSSEGGAAAAGKVEGASEWTRAFVWRSMVLNQMAALPADDPGRKITVLRVPDPKRPTIVDATETGTGPAAPAAAAASSSNTAAAASTPATKPLRVDMFQSSEKVSLTLYAKGVDAASLRVAFQGDQRVQLGPLPVAVAGAAGAIVLELGGAVDTSAESVKTTVTPYKIELSLVKKTGEKWGAWGQQLEADAVGTTAAEGAPALPASAAPITSSASYKAPAASASTSESTYPTSSRSGPKNWEKVIEEEAPNADEPDNDVNSFFKKLYASSGPEAQRAMMKSFVESNGTALSTDWSSVSTGKVETQPPEGVDVKEWKQ